MTEMQRQFEEWAHDDSKGYKLKLWHLINKDGAKVYTNALTSYMWESWQASRAAIVVKLPYLFDGSPDNATYYDYMYRKSEMEKALDDAGVDYE